MTSESVREVADRLNEIDAATLYAAADELEKAREIIELLTSDWVADIQVGRSRAREFLKRTGAE